jgi:hypothetical protein
LLFQLDGFAHVSIDPKAWKVIKSARKENKILVPSHAVFLAKLRVWLVWAPFFHLAVEPALASAPEPPAVAASLGARCPVNIAKHYGCFKLIQMYLAHSFFREFPYNIQHTCVSKTLVLCDSVHADQFHAHFAALSLCFEVCSLLEL